jgi:hypothetical protein
VSILRVLRDAPDAFIATCAILAPFAIRRAIWEPARMTRDEKALRAAIIAKARWMNASGLNQGTSGNISARSSHVMLIISTS